jgi:phosphomannomutase
MIPWLLVLAEISQSGKTLGELVRERQALFPCSGEINREVADAKACSARVFENYKAKALSVDYTDGLSMEFAQWRLNLRSSNTEPLVRLNVESRGSESLMREKTDEVLALMARG